MSYIEEALEKAKTLAKHAKLNSDISQVCWEWTCVSRCPSVYLYLCSYVPLYLYTSVPMFLCTFVPMYLSEMEKAADAADTSVLFFSAGVNF